MTYNSQICFQIEKKGFFSDTDFINFVYLFFQCEGGSYPNIRNETLT